MGQNYVQIGVTSFGPGLETDGKDHKACSKVKASDHLKFKPESDSRLNVNFVDSIFTKKLLIPSKNCDLFTI